MMRFPDFEVLEAPSVRRQLTKPGDIRSDIAFQNDINALLARIDQVAVPFRSVARMTSYGVNRGGSAAVAGFDDAGAARARQELHLLQGGLGMDDPSPRPAEAAAQDVTADEDWPRLRVRHGA